MKIFFIVLLVQDTKIIRRGSEQKIMVISQYWHLYWPKIT